jgi:hypothetical protein
VFGNVVVVIGVVIALESGTMLGRCYDGVAITRVLDEANVESLGQCLEWWRDEGESEVVC